MNKNYNIKITIESMINPSESGEKLLNAIKNIMNIEISRANHLLSGSSSDLSSIQPILEQVRSKSIFSVLRRLLLTNIENDSTFFLLNKQAATVNTVVLTENEQDSPLGTIKITVKSNDIMHIIERITPESQ